MDNILEEGQRRIVEEYNSQEDLYISKIKDSRKKIYELENLLGEVERDLFQLQKITDIKSQRANQDHPSWPRKNGLPISFEDLSGSIRDKRNKIHKLQRDLIEPIIYFMENANNLKMLKDHINNDEYIREQWYKVLFYMRMNVEEKNSDIP